jgi:hypothetical protein
MNSDFFAYSMMINNPNMLKSMFQISLYNQMLGNSNKDDSVSRRLAVNNHPNGAFFYVFSKDCSACDNFLPTWLMFSQFASRQNVPTYVIDVNNPNPYMSYFNQKLLKVSSYPQLYYIPCGTHNYLMSIPYENLSSIYLQNLLLSSLTHRIKNKEHNRQNGQNGQKDNNSKQKKKRRHTHK